MRLIFFGTPEFSLPALEALVIHHEVLLVVTQPDREKGRGKKVQMTPVKEYALSKGIPVFQPENVNEPQSVDAISRYHPDLAVVVAYGQILKRDLLHLPVFGCYNIHASLLPAYRGAAPIHRAIIEGESKTGITIMQMDQGMDTGDILLKEELAIDASETAGGLHDRLALLGAQAILKAIDRTESGIIVKTPQSDKRASYAPKLNKNSGEIDWQSSSLEIHNLVRGLNPWPAAYTFYKGRKMKIYESCPVDCEDGGFPPGTLIRIVDDGFLIQTGKNCLVAKCVQFPDSKAMSAREYARGHDMEKGLVLGK